MPSGIEVTVLTVDQIHNFVDFPVSSPASGGSSSGGGSSRPPVTSIVLTAAPLQSGLTSVVQWQDQQGGWNDVVNWRSEVGTGSVVWWVEEKDFKKGPFRWAIFQNGNLLTSSASFSLPSQARQVVSIAVNVR